MTLGERLKDLLQQAQQLVFGNRDRIHGAVDSVGNVADKTTKGRYSDHIAKAGEKAHGAVDKFGGTPTDTEAADAEGDAGADANEAEGMADSTEGEAEGSAEAAEGEAHDDGGHEEHAEHSE